MTDPAGIVADVATGQRTGQRSEGDGERGLVLDQADRDALRAILGKRRVTRAEILGFGHPAETDLVGKLRVLGLVVESDADPACPLCGAERPEKSGCGIECLQGVPF